MPNEVQLAYIAGMMDGEGYIALNRNTQHGQMVAQVGICNNNLESIIFIRDCVGGNVATHTHPNSNYKDSHKVRWTAKNKILDLLEQLEPYLIIKKPQAHMMIAWCKLDGYRSMELDDMFIQHMKVRGHEGRLTNVESKEE